MELMGRDVSLSNANYVCAAVCTDFLVGWS